MIMFLPPHSQIPFHRSIITRHIHYFSFSGILEFFISDNDPSPDMSPITVSPSHTIAISAQAQQWRSIRNVGHETAVFIEVTTGPYEPSQTTWFGDITK
jgi:hypothetical protein